MEKVTCPVYTWRHFIQGTRKTRPCLTGHPVYPDKSPPPSADFALEVYYLEDPEDEEGGEGGVRWRGLERAGGRLLHLYQGDQGELREPNLKKWVVTSNQMTLPQQVSIR